KGDDSRGCASGWLAVLGPDDPGETLSRASIAPATARVYFPEETTATVFPRTPPGRAAPTRATLIRGRVHVRLDLQGVGQFVHLVEEPDDRQQFAIRLAVQPQPLHGGRVAVDSIVTAVGRRYRQGDDLLRQQIQFARPHDRLQPGPAEF